MYRTVQQRQQQRVLYSYYTTDYILRRGAARAVTIYIRLTFSVIRSALRADRENTPYNVLRYVCTWTRAARRMIATAAAAAAAAWAHTDARLYARTVSSQP
uniref:Uncharacterized protein n=1 Tax=Trichogramma kaykai TaxID=54128 RepID=A0ABD2XE21_9HYME